MPEDIWKGGLGAIIFGICAYFLFPMLKAFTEASASRSGVDKQLHDLYQNLITERARLSEENARSTAAVVKLTATVETLQQALMDSRSEVTRLREEVARLTEALEHASN